MMGATQTSTAVEVSGGDDRELLARFVEGRDEQAFSELVDRHGRMALGVCRRILGDSNEADDAFQATFLVLISRAEELHRGREGIRSLGGWLHRVASNAALQVRRESRSRKRREAIFAGTRPDRSGDSPLVEVLPILDEEIRRLPDRYRAPLVLCYFEDRSQQGAADELGISYATLRRRLDQGRELLRGRLARRGCSIAIGLLGSILWESAAHADELGADATAALAGPLLQAMPSSSPSVRLSKKVLRMMRLQVIRRSAGLVLLLLLLVSSTGLVARVAFAGDGKKEKAEATQVAGGGHAKADEPDVPRRRGGSQSAPAKVPSPMTQPPAPLAKAPAAKPVDTGNPELDREILEGMGQGNGQGRKTFHGTITINGASREFDNEEEYQKAMQGMMPMAGPGNPGNLAPAPRESPSAKNLPNPAAPGEVKADGKARSTSKKAAPARKGKTTRKAAPRPEPMGEPGGMQGFTFGQGFVFGDPGFVGGMDFPGGFGMPAMPGMGAFPAFPGLPGMGGMPGRPGAGKPRVEGGVDGFDNAVGGGGPEKAGEKTPPSANPPPTSRPVLPRSRDVTICPEIINRVRMADG